MQTDYTAGDLWEALDGAPQEPEPQAQAPYKEDEAE